MMCRKSHDRQMITSDSDDDEGSVDPADQLFSSSTADVLRRQLLAQDEAERCGNDISDEKQEDVSNDDDDGIQQILVDDKNETSVLVYDIYLQNQRFYDDLKHCNCSYILYSTINDERSVLVEQDKTLGKGGLCWDAAFILAEYYCNIQQQRTNNSILELGSGTGLCGLLIAMCIKNCHVTITDLPKNMELLQRNLSRNGFSKQHDTSNADSELELWRQALSLTTTTTSDTMKIPFPRGTATCQPLSWGDMEQERQVVQTLKTTTRVSSSATSDEETADDSLSSFDVILGADVVATLYDPVLLADCIHRLSSVNTIVYISFKERLSTIHRQFETHMQELFQSVTTIASTAVASRNHNPDVHILIAKHKKKKH